MFLTHQSNKHGRSISFVAHIRCLYIRSVVYESITRYIYSHRNFNAYSLDNESCKAIVKSGYFSSDKVENANALITAIKALNTETVFKSTIRSCLMEPYNRCATQEISDDDMPDFIEFLILLSELDLISYVRRYSTDIFDKNLLGVENDRLLTARERVVGASNIIDNVESRYSQLKRRFNNVRN